MGLVGREYYYLVSAGSLQAPKSLAGSFGAMAVHCGSLVDDGQRKKGEFIRLRAVAGLKLLRSNQRGAEGNETEVMWASFDLA